MNFILKSGNVRSNAIQHIMNLDLSQTYEVSVQLFKDSRSKAQNAYWFVGLDKYAKPIFNEHGDNWTAWKIHEFVMKECGYTEVLITPNGEPHESRMHSSQMGKKKFNEMIEKGHAYLLTEHGIDIPLPTINSLQYPHK